MYTFKFQGYILREVEKIGITLPYSILTIILQYYLITTYIYI